MLESLINKVKAWRPAKLSKKTLTQVFSCEFYEIFKTSILKIICKRLLLKLNLPKVCKLSRVPESATCSSTAQTRLPRCKLPEELHFWVTTSEINHIIFLSFFITMSYLCSIMSCVLIVVLFVKQNVFISGPSTRLKKWRCQIFSDVGGSTMVGSNVPGEILK